MLVKAHPLYCFHLKQGYSYNRPHSESGTMYSLVSVTSCSSSTIDLYQDADNQLLPLPASTHLPFHCDLQESSELYHQLKTKAQCVCVCLCAYFCLYT